MDGSAFGTANQRTATVKLCSHSAGYAEFARCCLAWWRGEQGTYASGTVYRRQQGQAERTVQIARICIEE